MRTPSAWGRAPPDRPVPLPRATNGTPARAQTGCDLDALNIALENDALALGQRTDRWYTAGGRIAWSYRCAQPDGPVGSLVRIPGLLLGLRSAPVSRAVG